MLGAFGFWHSGDRADALCLRERFVSSGSLSLWPPGAGCSYGEPEMHDTVFNPLFLPTAIVVLAVTAGFAPARRAPRRQRAPT